METKLFTFDLPFEQIAQKPCQPRDTSKLLLCKSCGKNDFSYNDHVFSDIINFLTPNDFLVLNDAKVLPVRLLGNRIDEKDKACGAVEALLLKHWDGNEWTALLHLSAKVKPGLKLLFEPGLIAEVLSTHEDRMEHEGEVHLKFSGIALERMPLEKWLERHGHVPLPPYIERKANNEDKSNYQTVYARTVGSAAAPTAGFHFTPELLTKLQNQGVETGYVTLHVGLATFRPIKVSQIEQHAMHEETYEVSPGFLKQYMQAKQNGKRIIAVGTTVVRTLESWMIQCNVDQKNFADILKDDPDLILKNLSSDIFTTNLFIRPRYQFKAIDDLITNFHLPQSTLLVLVASFMGIPAMQKAYQHALTHQYRFFSYGDAMFIRG